MSSNLLVKSHLVAGVERPAPALRRHPLQPCRRRAGPPLGFGGSLAGKHSLDPAMWRRTANRLRNRQQLESSSWPVFKFKQSESRWARVSVTPEPFEARLGSCNVAMYSHPIEK